MESIQVDPAWDGALIRSTSQTVFDVLRVINNSPSAYKNRWLWELFQNTLDAAEGHPVSIRLEVHDNQFIFSHDGQPFSIDELVQLILKGSTKRTLSGKLGRFGTGFISTHVLSRVVNVEGITRGNSSFSFKLDRECQSAADLERKMSLAKEEMKQSLGKPVALDGYTTRFSFPTDNDYAKSLVKSSLENFSSIIPIVLALNAEIRKVIVVGNGHSRTWTKQSVSSVRLGIDIVKISAIEEEKQLTEILVLTMNRNGISLAIPVRNQENNIGLVDVESLPRIFIAFPLAGTESFPFPFIVNCREFEPTDDRDGIWMKDAASPEAQRNRPLIEEAVKMETELLTNIAELSWKDLHKLARISEVPTATWIDKDWLISIVRGLIAKLNELPIVEVVKGPQIKPVDALIPFGSD